MNKIGKSPDIVHTSGVECVHLLFSLTNNVKMNRYYGDQSRFWTRQVRLRNKLAEVVRLHKDATAVADQLFGVRWHNWIDSVTRNELRKARNEKAKQKEKTK